MMTDSDKATAAGVIGYHERTKHHYDRYARSPGYMDWANQPVPFRFYQDTPKVELPFLREEPPAAHLDLYRPAAPPARSIGLAAIAGLLELSVALSAWKSAGQSRWSLRINPSSGNLHPTETYLVLPPFDDHPAGVYHYNPLHHELERRAALPDGLWAQLDRHFQTDGFLIGLSSIFWRESWKYGERALRYCNHDVGHAIAAIRMAANIFGWQLHWLDAMADDAIETVLGIAQTAYEPHEAEHPDLLGWICPGASGRLPSDLPNEVVDAIGQIPFDGTPNPLSHKHIDWEIIGRTARLTQKPVTTPLSSSPANFKDFTGRGGTERAADLIRRRRSATAFSTAGTIPRSGFLQILEKTLPAAQRSPFDWGPLPRSTHLILFVHSVLGLAPGLYAYIRSLPDLEPLKRECRPEFQWSRVDPGAPLFLLAEGNYRQTATMVSCHQSIAGESVFSLGMLARFRENVQKAPYRYRWLFWEAGMIGQILYLEAEAHDLRGTGIGCYFDDAVHDLLGLKDDTYQSMYHFTVGLPVEDERLTTLPPYFQLKNRM
jgi:SagB-type dehydrogenase family enzyme